MRIAYTEQYPSLEVQGQTFDDQNVAYRLVLWSFWGPAYGIGIDMGCADSRNRTPKCYKKITSFSGDERTRSKHGRAAAAAAAEFRVSLSNDLCAAYAQIAIENNCIFSRPLLFVGR